MSGFSLIAWSISWSWTTLSQFGERALKSHLYMSATFLAPRMQAVVQGWSPWTIMMTFLPMAPSPGDLGMLVGVTLQPAHSMSYQWRGSVSRSLLGSAGRAGTLRLSVEGASSCWPSADFSTLVSTASEALRFACWAAVSLPKAGVRTSAARASATTMSGSLFIRLPPSDMPIRSSPPGGVPEVLPIASRNSAAYRGRPMSPRPSWSGPPTGARRAPS